MAAKITVNSQTADEPPGDSYFVTHLTVGSYHIKPSTAPLLASRSSSTFDLQFESGKTYFIDDLEDSSPFKTDGMNLAPESSGSCMRTMFGYAGRGAAFAEVVPGAPAH